MRFLACSVCMPTMHVQLPYLLSAAHTSIWHEVCAAIIAVHGTALPFSTLSTHRPEPLRRCFVLYLRGFMCCVHRYA